MSTGRPKTPIILSDEELKQLESIARSRSLPYGLVTRSQMTLQPAMSSHAERFVIAIRNISAS